MRKIVFRRCVVVLARDIEMSLYISSCIECSGCTVLHPRSEQELYGVLLTTHIDLVIVVASHPITLGETLYRWVDSLRSAGVDIFVVMQQHSVRHTIRLLGAGVRQCLTLPIAPQRLRSKVHKHLGIDSDSYGRIS